MAGNTLLAPPRPPLPNTVLTLIVFVNLGLQTGNEQLSLFTLSLSGPILLGFSFPRVRRVDELFYCR